MSYAIWIASYCGSFEEIAFSLRCAFKRLGMEVPIVREPVRGRTHIVLGACLLPKRPEKLPQRMIIYNMEQVTPGREWFLPSYGYSDLLLRYPVWDYSAQNVQILKKMGVKKPVLCGIGYVPELTRIQPAEKEDIDVLFYGTPAPRREVVLEGLRKAGLKVHTLTNTYGEERDALIARSKIVLNMHMYEAQVFELARVSYLLANKQFVVSETGGDATLEAPLSAGVAFVPYEKLVETCVHYCKPAQAEARKAIAEAGFAAFSALSQLDMLKSALAGTGVQAKEVAQPQERIFVALSGQSGVQATIDELFSKAAKPERVFIGACADPVKALPERQGQLLVKPYPSRGAAWARMLAGSQWRGEEYVLYLEAGAQLSKGWDAALVAMLKRAKGKAVISALLPEKLTATAPVRMGAGQVPENNIAALQPERVKRAAAEAKNTALLYPTPFASTQLLFMPAEAMKLVLPDPHLAPESFAFTQGARLWTHGFTLYQPDKTVAALADAKAPEAGNNLARRRARHVMALEAAAENDVALENIELYGHGNERDLDSFWRFAAVSESGAVSDAARKGMWDLRVLKEAAPAQEKPRIFVQIAAYRDPECQHTVADLFAKASYPERINVGICWQFIREEDQHCFQVQYPRPKQVRVIEKDAREGKGACWARALVQTLWQGEEYTLQIDSHMRFEPGWDEMLIAMLEQCGPKAVLTTYPAGYTPPDVIAHRITHRLTAKQFDAQGIFTMISKPVPQVPPPGKPVLGAFAGACMLFGRGDIIREVPYDPHLYFFGEEITLTVRLWTHGYEIYHPNVTVVYHDWNRKSRRTHFDDHEQWTALNRRSFARVRHLLGTEYSADAEVLRDIDKYGLGTMRSLAEYEAFSGVDFTKRQILPSAYEGIFPAPQHQPHAAPAKNGNGYAIARNSQPRKLIESPDCIVFDDFLPEQDYQALYDFATDSDYEFINTHGKVKRVWDISNGFPLRGDRNVFYYAKDEPQPKPAWGYPSNTPLDIFIDHVNAALPQVEHLVGKPGEWAHFSVNSWLYPPGTGLSMHDDGSGVYTGAYVYFLNPVWKPHWGGLLLVMENAANRAVQDYKKEGDSYKKYKRKWLHVSAHSDIMMENGLAQCVFPKRNRMVFIHPDAFHMVTQVQPTAGDNVRMSLAGFFGKENEKNKPKNNQQKG